MSCGIVRMMSVPDQSLLCVKGIRPGYKTWVSNKKRQDAMWDAYISDLKPSWLVLDADEEAVKESRCKRARSSERGLLNYLWMFFMLL